ncbi:hypothetical protein BDQ12DRAFT_688059 [Crucibulum laeve]|uniref:Uncharacterized protein n=1 Tax=Crucibulum laeve TaxID=68775 RepID=A0A5C3LUH1_9AGAR|nr:hypothetical protein BDQ12DRAFT_688059 [Crucibulum laeve]
MDCGHSSFISTSATSSLILKLQAFSAFLVSFLLCVATFIQYIPLLLRPSLLSLQLLKSRLRCVAHGGNNITRRHNGTPGTPAHLTLHFRNLFGIGEYPPLPYVISSFLDSLLSV